MAGALSGIRVADFSQMMQGPFATQKLADMGADVIKVEPTWGDLVRGSRPCGVDIKGDSPHFVSVNRNKRSVALDLKTDAGLEAAKAIVADADVLVENFRPGVMERLGLGYGALRDDNPGLVYVSASGFGGDGPYADRPGQDVLAQSLSGLAMLTGRKQDPPTLAGAAVADELSGYSIALHAMVALLHRERTGRGQRVEIDLLSTMVDFLCAEVTTVCNTDAVLERSETGIPYPTHGPPYGVYETADGHVTMAGFPTMETLGELIGLDPELYESPAATFEHRDEIKPLIADYVRDRPTEEVLEELLEAGCWVAEVNDLPAMIEDPQVEHNGMIVGATDADGDSYRTTGIPARLSETPGTIRDPPPRLGQHGREVLSELGYGDEAIEGLIRSGAMVVPDGPG